MDENVSINLNEEEVTTLEGIKAGIKQDIVNEISQMGYKVIENNYFCKNDYKLVLQTACLLSK